MALYKFEPNDIYYNTIITNPSYHFYVNSKKVYMNGERKVSGAFSENVKNVPVGYVSLYEMNIDRLSGSNPFVYPFITKEGTRNSFKTVDTTTFDNSFQYGDILTGSYPLSSSISRIYYQQGVARRRINALKNTLNQNTVKSSHYAYSSSLGDKGNQELNLISIPSIIFGSKVKPGTIKLQYYVSGTLIGQIEDINGNGDLIQTLPIGSNESGSVAGVILYKQGFLLLTGSWALEVNARDYINDGNNLQTSSWLHYGAGMNDEVDGPGSIPEVSYNMFFSGTTYVPTLTMFAHARKGELNYSNNPTYLERSDAGTKVTSSLGITERSGKIKNTISSSYTTPTASFEQQTFITKIAIYDENKNIIAIANIAKPVKKKPELDYTFKLKYDI